MTSSKLLPRHVLDGIHSPVHLYTGLPHCVFGAVPQSSLRCYLLGCSPHFALLLLRLSRFNRVRLFATPWTAAYQAPPSMGFSRQEYWSEVPLTHNFHVIHFIFQLTLSTGRITHVRLIRGDISIQQGSRLNQQGSTSRKEMFKD